MNETLRSEICPRPETIVLLKFAARVMQRNRNNTEICRA